MASSYQDSSLLSTALVLIAYCLLLNQDDADSSTDLIGMAQNRRSILTRHQIPMEDVIRIHWCATIACFLSPRRNRGDRINESVPIPKRMELGQMAHFGRKKRVLQIHCWGRPVQAQWTSSRSERILDMNYSPTCDSFSISVGVVPLTSLKWGSCSNQSNASCWCEPGSSMWTREESLWCHELLAVTS